MRYLVTGGAGFIGSNFIHYLLSQYPDCDVINFDKLTYAGNLENLKGLEEDPRYNFVKGDIADAATVDKIVEIADIVVNFAAETHVDRSIIGPAEFIKTNVLGTQILLDAAVKHKKRFHHISTDEVFGSLALDAKEKFTEQTPYNPSSPYSASKASSDHLVRSYVHTYGLQATITNCSNNYGPYQFVEKFIPLIITNALKNQKIPIYGDGLYVRDWIYVKDHNTAVDLVINNGKIGETYLVGGNSEHSNIEVAKLILKNLGKDENLIEFTKDRQGHDRRYAIDSGKIERELKWSRTYKFEQGLAETVKWYLANQEWWEKLLSKEYLKYYEKQYGKHL